MFFRVISKKTGSSIAPVYSYPLWYFAVLLYYNTKPLGTFLGRKMKEIEIVFIVANYSIGSTGSGLYLQTKPV